MTNNTFHDVEVFHRDVMDDEHRKLHPEATPWLVVFADASIKYFVDEDSACEFQRGWREAAGRNPMTGEIDL